MEYFSAEEKAAMLGEGYEADSRLFHQGYEEMIAPLAEKPR